MTENVGSSAMAAAAQRIAATHKRPFNDIGPDWKYLGSGCARHAFLGPDNVVYKIAIDDYGIRQQRREIETIEKMRGVKLNSNWSIPNATQYNDVIAMEYIEEFVAYPEKAPVVFENLDTRSNNIRRKGGVWYLIDFG